MMQAVCRVPALELTPDSTDRKFPSLRATTADNQSLGAWTMAKIARKPADTMSKLRPETHLPNQIVLVLHGGGALDAYQVGVYQTMHEVAV